MKFAARDYIIHTVFKTNILPVISECNTSCVFCSHKQNPRDVEVFRLPELTLEDFAGIIEYLSPDKKIVIGEAATRIIEGEPLLHKNFYDILLLIRRKFKHTEIQVTTNGILLDDALIYNIIKLGNISLNISVNCVNPCKRARILGLKQYNDIKPRLEMLKGRIKFSGSCVFVPEILCHDDIEELAALLDECGADCLRVFLPGYTSKTCKGMDLESLYCSMRVLVDKLKLKYSIPVIIEPSIISDLQCTIEGVVKNSPAYMAGAAAGDVVLEVDGVPARTRVEAFNMTYRLNNPVLKVKRDDGVLCLKILKRKNSSPGFVMLYDIDPDVSIRVVDVVRHHNAGNVLFLTSEMAYGVIKELLDICKFDFKYDIARAKNLFFGGTIKCAGLLTNYDVLDAAHGYLIRNDAPDLIILPSIMYDYRKVDLQGRHIKEIEDILKIPVDTI